MATLLMILQLIILAPKLIATVMDIIAMIKKLRETDPVAAAEAEAEAVDAARMYADTRDGGPLRRLRRRLEKRCYAADCEAA